MKKEKRDIEDLRKLIINQIVDFNELMKHASRKYNLSSNEQFKYHSAVTSAIINGLFQMAKYYEIEEKKLGKFYTHDGFRKCIKQMVDCIIKNDEEENEEKRDDF